MKEFCELAKMTLMVILGYKQLVVLVRYLSMEVRPFLTVYIY